MSGHHKGKTGFAFNNERDDGEAVMSTGPVKLETDNETAPRDPCVQPSVKALKAVGC